MPLNDFENQLTSANIALPKTKTRLAIEKIGLIISAIGVTAAIIVPFIVELWKDSYPGLTLRIISSRALVNIDPHRSGDIEMTFQGQRVRSPYLISAVLQNTSNIPVESKNIYVPPTIYYKEARLLRANILEEHPAGLNARLRENADSVSIIADLINPGETINFELLFDQAPDITRVEFRLAGGSPINFLETNSGLSSTNIILPFPSYLIYVIFVFSFIIWIYCNYSNFCWICIDFFEPVRKENSKIRNLRRNSLGKHR